jgi:predicted HicB family RNase H-like nuclease
VTPTSKITPFGLRLQPELKARLEASARNQKRSLNSEIAARLESPTLVLDAHRSDLPSDPGLLDAWLRERLVPHLQQCAPEPDASAAEFVQFKFRLPAAMHAELAATAKARRRSISAEIVSRLVTDGAATTAQAPRSKRLRQFADSHGLDDATVRKLILAGDLVARRVGRITIITEDDERAWLASLPLAVPNPRPRKK